MAGSHWRTTPLLAGAVAAALALTACGGSGGAVRPPADPVSDGGEQVDSPAPAALRAMPTSTVGRVAADQSGRTLYRFDRDRTDPPASACLDACARRWPPVRWTPDLKSTGVDRDRIGRMRRPDGSWQVTLGGRPLYRFAGDGAPGETRGNGADGAWFAATPSGARARTVQPAPPGAQVEDAPTGGGPASGTDTPGY